MEILIAIFILGIVMATILGTFTGIITSSRIAEKRAELYQTGRAVMDLISADIRGIFNQAAGGKGSFFLGAIETIEDKSMSKMDFVTTNSLPGRLGKNPFLSERGYRVKKNPKGSLYSLWRRSQSPAQDSFQDGGMEVPVCRIIESFNLEFMLNNDKNRGLSNSIPEAVIIDFTLNLDGEKESFVTMVRPMITAGG